jgi:DNA repair protein RecN (Recombination protein N)
VIQKLSRKHHVSPEELPELAENLTRELDGVTHSGERIAALTLQTEELLMQYQKLASELTSIRQQQAIKLQQHISAMIKELGMPQGEFLVDCSALEGEGAIPKLNGKDKVEFLVCANPGLPAKPLAKVASGGELSRISLAIQVTTSSDNTTPTMIFDEVDSGIGGGIAEIVGQKLRSLGLGRQVICVTHLPQVAAQAHSHLYVEKNSKTDVTSSSVRLLDNEERVEEIARMLGGIIITENTRTHAREMLTTGNKHQ